MEKPYARRKQLLKLTNDYLTALCRKTPEAIPVAPHVRATCNGRECPVGQNDVWTYTVRIPERQTFVDPENDSVVFFGVITNDVVNIPANMTRDKFYYARWSLYMLRLKMEGDQIAEIEELTNDQPTHSFIPINEVHIYQPIYDMLVPEDELLTREELVKIVDDYWSACAKELPPSTVAAHPDGFRSEQGMKATDSARFPYSLTTEFDLDAFNWRMPRAERRYPVVDAKRGVVVAIVVMANAGPQWPRGAIVWEVFKIDAGLMKSLHCGYRILLEDSGWSKPE